MKIKKLDTSLNGILLDVSVVSQTK